ncbi:hypothetical protein B1992_08845 [Pseudoxanthomonas broegbernensis]|uniref:Uncharacterized protein n=1 Tax=Pseudoxanthomonas broegbernensis TaxID=83619 RepID=A0A7V8GMC5_9GAMM|nr:DUF6498-containing protein [Pseudoxanthomonas broegbernensis]KAF1686320.1 hypothetical protein B1992_08845 [Pseudoxanthomonas broegbernensis]MBB6064006.1 hypothetical protein [Pseudoxanthomonas broegbernensis]
MDAPRGHSRARCLPDLLAFAAGIGWAWWNGWDTRTLVWSLWLSSLAVGYVSIVAGILATAGATRQSLRGGLAGGAHAVPPSARAPLARLATPLALLYGLFLLAFFSLHFGGFHWGHSVFLNMFFPIDGGDPLTRSPMPRLDEYLAVLRQGGGFVPLALVAERGRLLAPSPATGRDAGPVAPDARMAAPYRNVIRLHLLIFFFACAVFAGIGGMWAYLAVYAVYFFPWRWPRLRRTPVAE